MPANPFGIKPIKLDSIYGTVSKKRDKQPAHLKTKTRQRWWGDNIIGDCFSCGRKLHYDDADVGHIQAASKGGKWSPENCRLVCRTCNSGMRATNMKVYMKKTYPERYERFFPQEQNKKKTGVNKPKRRKSGEQTWINPFTGRKEKLNLF